jgi:N-glycosylase/DNA lyase
MSYDLIMKKYQYLWNFKKIFYTVDLKHIVSLYFRQNMSNFKIERLILQNNKNRRTLIKFN